MQNQPESSADFSESKSQLADRKIRVCEEKTRQRECLLARCGSQIPQTASHAPTITVEINLDLGV